MVACLCRVYGALSRLGVSVLELMGVVRCMSLSQSCGGKLVAKRAYNVLTDVLDHEVCGHFVYTSHLLLSSPFRSCREPCEIWLERLT